MKLHARGWLVMRLKLSLWYEKSLTDGLITALVCLLSCS